MIHVLRSTEGFVKNANKICIHWKILMYIEGCESQFFSIPYYPPGARLSRPPHLCTQRLYFFLKNLKNFGCRSEQLFWKILLYIEGCESQFFRFNRSMIYWYAMLSPEGAIIANKYLCLKGVRKRIWNLGQTISGSAPNFSKKSIASVCKDEVV